MQLLLLLFSWFRTSCQDSQAYFTLHSLTACGEICVADDGKTTTCELLLFMTYLTSRAEDFAARRAVSVLPCRRRRCCLIKLRTVECLV